MLFADLVREEQTQLVGGDVGCWSERQFQPGGFLQLRQVNVECTYVEKPFAVGDAQFALLPGALPLYHIIR